MNLIAFSHRLSSLEGQIFAIFVIAIAAGEAAVGLAIIIQLYRLRSSVNVDEAKVLNG
ncbi:MAG: NADH-quinone oxidoreductase subunit NuoK [Thermoanaerobaculia bacterium]